MAISYLALLRGVNVGGNNLLSMAALRAALEGAGFADVRTYIQSGNVLFSSSKTDDKTLARAIERTIKEDFGLTVDVVVFSRDEWRDVVQDAPKWWGTDKSFKHNLFVMLDPDGVQQVEQAVEKLGGLKPDIEYLEGGKRVVYQSHSLKAFGRAIIGKIVGDPVYKRMTIRNYNTTRRLLELMESVDK